MDILFKAFLILHIITGTIGLLCGTINMIAKKGNQNHKLIGKIFLYCMLIVALSAFFLSVLHPNYFLFIVGVFTLYMTATGERYLFLKQLKENQKPKIIDWALTLFMILFGLAFVAFGAYHLIHSEGFGLVFIVFGYIGLRMSITDISNYRGNAKASNYWLVAHLQRMIGAYIAALTAFLVVNSNQFPAFIPGYVLWLLPTVIVVPLIIKWTKKYEVKNKS